MSSRRVSRASYLRGLRRGGADSTFTCAAWASRSSSSTRKEQDIGHVIFAKKLSSHGPSEQQQEEEEEAVLEIASYDFQFDVLSETIHTTAGERVPECIAVHPGGDGVLCFFQNSCKLYKLETRGHVEFRASDENLFPLQGIGQQNNLVFSTDGSRLATGGKDGHLRVFEWPSLKIKFDQPEGCKFLRSLDLSLDGAFLTSVPDDGNLCRVWDIEKSVLVTTIIQSEKGERFGPCRFSRDGALPFLFVVVVKAGKGCIGVWEMEQWSKIGVKVFSKDLITSFATRHDGKFLAFGTAAGDISVVEAKKMAVVEVVKDAHSTSVIDIHFSPNGRALLSTSSDSTARVTKLRSHKEWKESQVYLLLALMILASAALFYIFFEYSDSFWKFPLGRNQPAKPPLEAIFGGPPNSDE